MATASQCSDHRKCGHSESNCRQQRSHSCNVAYDALRQLQGPLEFRSMSWLRFSADISFSGLPLPVSFKVSAGALPDGISATYTVLAQNAVVRLSGVPIRGGSFVFNLTGTDASGCQTQQLYRFLVFDAISQMPPEESISSIIGRPPSQASWCSVASRCLH
jgi:hypothetical protein